MFANLASTSTIYRRHTERHPNAVVLATSAKTVEQQQQQHQEESLSDTLGQFLTRRSTIYHHHELRHTRQTLHSEQQHSTMESTKEQGGGSFWGTLSNMSSQSTIYKLNDRRAKHLLQQ